MDEISNGDWATAEACLSQRRLRQQRKSFIPKMIPQNPDNSMSIFRLCLLPCFSTLGSFLKRPLEFYALVIKVCVLITRSTWQMSLGYSGLSNSSSALSRICKIMTLNHTFQLVTISLWLVRQNKWKKIKGHMFAQRSVNTWVSTHLRTSNQREKGKKVISEG